MNITSAIAQFIFDTKFGDLPGGTIEKAKLAFLDWLGVTLAGSADNSSKLLFNTLRQFSGRGQATVLGFGQRMDIFTASLLNGYFSHVLDYDDIHLGMIGHPSIPVVPAILSVAEWRRNAGREFILAFILGVEVECRLGEGVNPDHYDRGWHSTATLGHFGAATAAAKLLNLDRENIVHAMGIAGTQASGVRQVFGSMCKPLHPGKAAMNGLLAAILAKNGFTSSREIIGGEKGFTSVLCDKFDPKPLTFQLGEKWKVDEIIFKRHASCYRTHAVIDCMLSMRRQLTIVPEKVASVHCRISPLAWDMAGILMPKKGLEGKFSQPFCAAVALVEGKAMNQQFTDEKVMNPVVIDLMKKTKVEVDEHLATTEAVVKIVLEGGREFTEQRDTEKIRPSEEQILADLKEKFESLISQISTDEKGKTILDAITNLETVGNMGDLVRLFPKVDGQK